MTLHGFLHLEADAVHGDADEAAGHAGGFGFEKEGVVYPMVLHVFVLGPIGHRRRHRISAGGEPGHLEGEFPRQELPGRTEHRGVHVAQKGVVSEQALPEPVLYIKADDGGIQRLLSQHFHPQHHFFPPHDPCQGIAFPVQKLHRRDPCRPLPEGWGVRVEFEQPDVVSQVARVDELTPLVHHARADSFLRILLPAHLDAGGGALALLRLVEGFQVTFAHFLGRSFLLHLSLFDPDGPCTKAAHGRRVVTHEQHRSRLHEVAQKTHAFLGEKSVPNGQGFVDDQDVRVHVSDHGECQAHVHAARIILDGLLDEVPDVREGGDVVESCVDFFLGEPQHRRIHVHILAAGEFGIEARSQLEQGRRPPPGMDGAGGGRQGPADQLKQGGLARSVAPDDPHRFPPAHLERYPSQSPELLVVPNLLRGTPGEQPLQRPHQPPDPWKNELLQPIARCFIDMVALAQSFDPNGCLAGIGRHG